MTDNPNAAIKALCKAQAAMPRAIKDSDNPFFKSKYADLTAVQDACFPPLQENGFAIIHTMGQNDTGSYLETILMHESGAVWSCPVPLIVDKGNMQGLGSAITYARRYGIMCLSGVAPEDDDGNNAVANPPKRNQQKPPTATDDPFKATTSDIECEVTKIASITSMEELGGYWNMLNNAQPDMAHNTDVIAAKDRRKQELAE